jgi:hypothetical protein
MREVSPLPGDCRYLLAAGRLAAAADAIAALGQFAGTAALGRFGGTEVSPS